MRLVPRPFPQFEGETFDTPDELLAAIVAWMGAQEAETPHAVLISDPETDRRSVNGPYPTAYLAAVAAQQLHAELNDPADVDDDGDPGLPVQVTVVPITIPGG